MSKIKQNNVFEFGICLKADKIFLAIEQMSKVIVKIPSDLVAYVWSLLKLKT